MTFAVVKFFIYFFDAESIRPTVQNMKNVFAICIIVATASTIWCKNTKLVERFSWKQVDFDFPDERSRMEMIKNGVFIPENNLPLGLERWKNKLFVTLPRWKSGTAATLTYIDLESNYLNNKLLIIHLREESET